MSLKPLLANMGDIGNGTGSPYTIEQTYEELMQGSVPCPTCRGTGRIPTDGISNDKETASNDVQDADLSVTIDQELIDKIRKEMKTYRVNQTVFAGVSFGRTQGLLSDLLRKAQGGGKINRAMYQNFRTIEEFLKKPDIERIQLYKEYKMEDKEKRRLRKEYYGDTPDAPYKQQVVISAHAKGVMMEYYNKISQTPDKSGYDVLSEVLNLDKDVIQRFFNNQRQKSGEDRTKMESNEQIQEEQAN